MLEGIHTDQSIDIFIRHGKSKYTDKLPDLTDEGICEIENTAIELKGLVLSYPNLRLNTSPAARAVGSLDVFSRKVGIKGCDVNEVQDLRPVDIYHFTEFMDALNDPKYKKEYEAYMLKREFDNPDPETRVCERRCDIRKRATDFFIRRMGSDDYREGAEPVCSLNTTHFEIVSSLLAAFYGDINNFPIDLADGPKNGEAIAIQKYSPREMVIYARSMSVIVAFSDLK